MTLSDQLQQRSDLVGTQIITRDTGKKLGVINQLWVDVDQREVVALGLRDTLFTGNQRYMLLSSIRQVGDVILVDDEYAIEDVNIFNYSPLVASEVITEAGELLGKVRGFKFDINNGQISYLIIASSGLPLIPSQLISTYELPIDEIASSGPERLIVFEGAEERLNQLTVGVLERLGIGVPPWEQEEDEYITTSTGNQLGSGLQTPYAVPSRQRVEENWEEEEAWPIEEPAYRQREYEYDYVEEPAPPPPRRQRQYEYDYVEEPAPPPPRRQESYDYGYDQAEDWAQPPSREEPTYGAESSYEAKEQEVYEEKQDIWDEDYEAPEINLTQQIKAPEYEETDY